jgi:asparagine synthase (glutamine-hydrolysing)
MLPPGVLDRPKQGFVVPLNRWLDAGLLDRFDDACLGCGSRVSAWMERKAVASLRREPLGERPRQDVYALLVLELWLRRLGV